MILKKPKLPTIDDVPILDEIDKNVLNLVSKEDVISLIKERIKQLENHPDMSFSLDKVDKETEEDIHKALCVCSMIGELKRLINEPMVIG